MAQSLRDWDVQTESKICGTEVRAGAAVHEAASRTVPDGIGGFSPVRSTVPEPPLYSDQGWAAECP